MKKHLKNDKNPIFQPFLMKNFEKISKNKQAERGKHYASTKSQKTSTKDQKKKEELCFYAVRKQNLKMIKK